MIELATDIALSALGLAVLLLLIRIARGPTVADRILGLDALTVLGAAILGVFAVRTGAYLYADLAVVLVLVGFVATIAFARYLLSRGRQ